MAHTTDATHSPETPSEQRQRQLRDQAPTHGVSNNHLSLIKDIRPASPLKHNQIFGLISDGGDILKAEVAQGFYYHDMRHLSQCELQLNGHYLTALLSDTPDGSTMTIELTNPALKLANGAALPKESVSIRREYRIDERLTQRITVQNLAQRRIPLTFTLTLASDFADIFVIRGRQPGKRGTIHPPHARDASLTLSYDGADEHHRLTNVHFSPQPQRIEDGVATFTMTLEQGERQQITLTCAFEDHGPTPLAHQSTTDEPTTDSGHERERHNAIRQALAHRPQITTDNEFFNAALDRSFADLAMLATADAGDVYISAGVPWYVALFGRDSLIAAFETLAYQPQIARATLDALARYQGRKHDAFTHEEPGKILHELRLGEQANLREIPQIPSYGSVDSTLWFLMLLAEYIRWTGDLSAFHDLHTPVERALAWLDANPAAHGVSFIAYGSASDTIVRNYGWKDSDDGIVNGDGALAQPPIQLVEVQAYAYRALCDIADLYRATDDERRAADLLTKASDLKQRFNERFWSPQQQYYYLALQRDDRPANAIASNPGQVLFTGIADDDKARAVAERLMRDDLFCGWGVRTLSSAEAAYNPLVYQRGSVWPHDNALIALGLRRHGFVERAEHIFTGIFQAATKFEHFRLPEVFDGFAKTQYSRPVRYPVACNPQAWAAGALPLLLQTALGLEPDALHHTLRIRRPRLPHWLTTVTVRGLRLADASVDLHYTRQGDATYVAQTASEGNLTTHILY